MADASPHTKNECFRFGNGGNTIKLRCEDSDAMMSLAMAADLASA
jgi:hypothetical protein